MTTRLQRHVCRRPTRQIAGGIQCMNFGMRLTGNPVPAFSYTPAILD